MARVGSRRPTQAPAMKLCHRIGPPTNSLTGNKQTVHAAWSTHVTAAKVCSLMQSFILSTGDCLEIVCRPTQRHDRIEVVFFVCLFAFGSELCSKDEPLNSKDSRKWERKLDQYNNLICCDTYHMVCRFVVNSTLKIMHS